MDDGPAGSGSVPAIALAALLTALAEGADGEHGSQIWDSLTDLLSQSAVPGVRGRDLDALGQAPDDEHLAAELARLLVAHTSTDDSFRSAMDTWRVQNHIRLIEDWIRQNPRKRQMGKQALIRTPIRHQ